MAQDDKAIRKRCEEYAAQHLVGRRIVEARYMTPKEVKTLMWNRAALVLVLDDGTAIYPQCDDEGNDAGALAGISTVKDEDLLFGCI